jgi:hypothetical protein
MEFRTTFRIEPSQHKLTYDDRVMLIGSCFTSSVGSKMEMGKMDVMINPAGTVYNPVSVCNTLDIITSGKQFTRDDLLYHDGLWFSFFHYTDFSSEDPVTALEKINSKLKEAADFLGKSTFLFITFGTARIFRWKKSGLIVSNCHKIPADQFSSELLSVQEVVTHWSRQLDKLNTMFPQLKVIFTISPVRHWKDGAHGNQVSKSVLFLAVEELLGHPANPEYFPAYELVMDDLRDYRFYNDDMLHPSPEAINYVWDAFSESYFDRTTAMIWSDAVKITKACSHRFISDNISKKKIFAEKMLKQISLLEERMPSLGFSSEKTYFQSLLIK